MFVDFNILNQLGSPAINSNTFANRPAAGQTGRLFVSTDTFEIYRDNGTTWDLIGGPGTSTITGTGTATQVAYFTSSQAIGSSANLFWDNTNTRLGIGTATPGAALDIHGTGIMQQINSTSATANSLLAFQRSGTGLWRIGDVYNSGSNYFEIFNTAISTNAIAVLAATNKTEFTAVQTYTTGLARANYFDYNLSVAAGGSFSSPNAITALGASLDLTLAGSATIPSGARSGLDAYNSIGFTGAGTLTHNQGAQIRAYSNVTAGWAFNGSATGTVTHLAGLRALFPDNTGSAINVTNNYALLLNDQTPNTGTVTYTNRWGVYQEGASDLNYMAANLLLGSTVNNGNKLQVTGNADFTGNVGIGTSVPEELLELSSSNTTGGQLLIESTGLSSGDYAGMRFKIAGGSNGGYEKAGIFALRGSGGYNDLSLIFATNTVADATNVTSANEKMRLDASGNLGLGVSPSAWGSGYAVMQYKGGFVGTSGSSFMYYGQNAYTDGSFKYVANGQAGIYAQDAGQHIWYNAPTGTAGNAITFTQAMTLDANGNLGLGTANGNIFSTAGANNVLGVQATGTNQGGIVAISGTGSGFSGIDIGSGTIRRGGIYTLDGSVLTFYTNGSNSGTSLTERARFTAGGNFLIGTTTDAGQKLQVNGSVTSTTITQTQTSATAILKQIGNSNAEGAAQKITIVRQYSVVSLGTKLIIPFTSQTNLNSTTICKVFGHGARYNSRGPLGFEITFAVGHLNLLDNLSSWNGNGNYASIAINGMSIEITFTANYTAATSDGVFVTIEYMTGTESYSIDVPNIAMN